MKEEQNKYGVRLGQVPVLVASFWVKRCQVSRATRRAPAMMASRQDVHPHLSFHFMLSCSHLPFCLLIFLVLSGCATSGDLARYDRQLRSGSFQDATQFADARASAKNRNELLWNLQAGSAARYSRDYQASIRFFDQAEELVKEYKLKNAASTVAESLSSMLLNDSARDYQPAEYDGIMVNTYKAFNYLALRRPAEARVEFNRALDRQRRAKIGRAHV